MTTATANEETFNIDAVNPVVVRFKRGIDVVAKVIRTPIMVDNQIIGARLLLYCPVKIDYIHLSPVQTAIQMMYWIDTRVSDASSIEVDEDEILAILPVSGKCMAAYNAAVGDRSSVHNVSDDDKEEEASEKEEIEEASTDDDDDTDPEEPADDYIVWGGKTPKGNVANIKEFKNSKVITDDWYMRNYFKGKFIPQGYISQGKSIN
jgi:hypothetical protein